MAFLSNKQNQCFTTIIVAIWFGLFSAQSWGASAGCDATNGNTLNNAAVVGVVANASLNFDQGDVLTFQYSVAGPTTGQIFDATASVNVFGPFTGAGSVSYTIPASGSRVFQYSRAGAGVNTFGVLVTCAAVARDGDNAQNDVITLTTQQSNELGDLINRYVNTYTSESLSSAGSANRLTESEELNNQPYVLAAKAFKKTEYAFQSDFWNNSTEQLETENFAVVMSAAAEYSTDSINRALRAVNLQQYFIFSDISGVLIFDDRGPSERRGQTLSGSAGIGYRYNDQFTFGLAGSFSTSDKPLAATAGETEIDSFILNPFISYQSANGLVWTINGGIGSQDNNLNTGTATAKFESRSANIGATLQGNWRKGRVILNPRGSVTYDYIDVDGFTNSVGFVNSRDSELIGAVHFDLGITHDGFEISPDVHLLPFVDLGFDWALKRPDSSFLANGTTFKSEPLTGEIGGGIRLVKSDGFELLIEGNYRQIGETDIDEVQFGAQLSYGFE